MADFSWVTTTLTEGSPVGDWRTEAKQPLVRPRALLRCQLTALGLTDEAVKALYSNETSRTRLVEGCRCSLSILREANAATLEPTEQSAAFRRAEQECIRG